MSGEVTGARYLAEALARIGVTHAFFVDAVLRRTLVEFERVGIRRMLAHSEKAAAYMADGYARASGRVGVCMAQSVGAANLAAGLQDAYLHRAPVLALTGRKPPLFRQRNAYQEIEHAPLYAPVTKFQADVATAEELPILLAQALREATEGTPRPVHLDLCGHLAEQTETTLLTDPPLPDAQYGSVPAHRPSPDLAEIEAAAAALAGAKRPVIVAGSGAIVARAHEQLSRLAERFDLPIATSLGGRGIMPTTHRLHLGVVGTYSAPVTNQLVHEADLVLYLGCHTGDQVTNNWTVPTPGTAIVQIDIDGREIGRNYPGVIGVQGDPVKAIQGLGDTLDGSPDWRVWAAHAKERFDAWHRSMDEARHADAMPLRVERLCHELSEALPEDAVLVADTGYSGIWTGIMVELKHPGQSYLRAAGSLGWAFPAALGAQCAAPERPVVCFCGDGAFYYHLPELETAKRRDLPVVVVVNNNSAFAQGLPSVRALYADASGDPDEIIRFGPTDFAQIARAFGVEGIRVEQPEQIRPALERAIALRAPVVVDVVTDAEPRAPAPWSPPS